jgi:hypothetical protein
VKDLWYICHPPWTGIDDPEPNDSPGEVLLRVDLELCQDTRYGGRLWRADGTSDLRDSFYFVFRRPGPLRVSLDVPSSTEVDYDMVLWRLLRGQFNRVGLSNKMAGVDETISTALPSGEYWIQVYSAIPDQQIREPYVLSWDYGDR